MKKYKIHHIDAFTDTKFEGNPTVTVLEADSLSDEEMQKIAREMNLSETGFILTSKKGDFRLRFFTPPGNEIKFCGHATVGALCTIAREGLFGCTKKKNHFSVETKAGLLNMTVDLSNPKSPDYIFDSPKIKLVPAPYTLEQLIKFLGIPKRLVDLSKPLMLEKTNNYLYFACPNLDSLAQLDLDMRQATEFAKKDGIVIFCALTNETFDPKHHLHARGFAPLVGVPEDPFTGSMQGGLAAYALAQGMLKPKDNWIGVEQGHFIDRPGKVMLEIVKRKPIEVRLHAKAVQLFSATI